MFKFQSASKTVKFKYVISMIPTDATTYANPSTWEFEKAFYDRIIGMSAILDTNPENYIIDTINSDFDQWTGGTSAKTFSPNDAGKYYHITFYTYGGNSASYVYQVPSASTLSYNTCGGTNVNSSDAVFTGGTTTVTNDTPTRDGYIFAGWYDNENYEGTKYDANQEVILNSDMVLYAKWIPITYTVKYNGNGATEGSTVDSSHTYDIENALTPNGFERKYIVTYNHNYAESTNISKTATYVFNGWSTESDGTKIYNNSQIIKNLTTANEGTVNLYANWNPSSVSYIPTREGYIFEGWYSDEECTNKITDNEYTPTEDTILYAKWEKKKDLEETISIEVTKKWIDNNIQALRRPEQIKFIVTQYKEIPKESVVTKEEIISDENTSLLDGVKSEENNTENKVEEPQEDPEDTDENTQEAPIIDEKFQETTEINKEVTDENLEENKTLENAFSNEIVNLDMVNNVTSEIITPKNINIENKALDLNQEEQVENANDLNEEKNNLEQEDFVQDDNSAQPSKEPNIAEENMPTSKTSEESNVLDEAETINPVNTVSTTTLEVEKVEVITYEYTMPVNKEDNETLYILEGIPRYDKETEEEIKYIITEEEVNEGDLKFYASTEGLVTQETDEEGNVKYSTEIVNTFKLPENNTRNITAIKNWNDNNKISTRPTSIILELIGRVEDIIETQDEQSVSNSNDWKNTFTSVPIYDENGQEIEYTLQEKADQEILDKYISEVSEINESNEIIVTNSLIIQDSKIEKTGTEEINAIDSKVNYSIDYTFELDNKYTENANIEIIDTLEYELVTEKSEILDGTIGEDNKTITWTGSYNPINKTITWDNETEGINVTVTENEERNVQVITVHLEIGITYKDLQVSTEKITNKVSGKITLANDVTDIVEDSFETETRWVKDVIVNKMWKGDTEKTRPESIELQLLSITKDENNQDVEYALDESIETTKTLSKDTDWTATLWAELPSYDETGKEIHYMVKEIDIDGYKSEILQINEETSKVEITIQNTKWYKLPITGGIGVDTVRSAEALVGIVALILITNRKKVVPERRSKVEAKKIKKLEKLSKRYKRK